MDTYSLLRQIADSWVLLAMFCFFLGVIVWAFRPGSSRLYKDISAIPLRQDTPAPNAPCCNACKDCRCRAQLDFLKGKHNV